MSGATDAAGNAWAAYVAARERPVNVERQAISVNQFAELLGFDAARFIGLQVNKQSQTIWLILEPCDTSPSQERGSTLALKPA